jgi:hypothetical protein
LSLPVRRGVCGRPRRRPANRGARDVAASYGDALLHRDWPRAYATLDTESQARLAPEEFTRLAEQYRAGMGFEPEVVHVTACEQHGVDALAHIAFTGWAAGKYRRYKDAVALRHSAAVWGVVVLPHFGRGKTR